MASFINMFVNGENFNLVILVPIVAVLVAVVLLLKLSARRPEPKNKAQNVKNLKMNTNSKKEEKTSSEKKDKTIKEKKTSSRLLKNVDTNANDIVKSKPNKKQPVADENSPKKSNQTKKQQINNVTAKSNKAPNKNNNQNNKNQLANLTINKTDDGEWQTVTTKKQKQNKPEETIEVTTPSKTNKRSQKITPNKTNKSVNKNINVKVANDEQNGSSVVTGNVELIPEMTINNSVPAILSNDTEVIDIKKNVVVEDKQLFEPSSPITSAIFIDNEVKTSIDQSAANVAFDELGDAAWIDTKPQKKNRKRALRE